MPEVRSEMMGSIVHVAVTEGATVKAGDTIVMIESMKTEIPVVAELGGRVARLTVGKGSSVRAGDLIAVLD